MARHPTSATRRAGQLLAGLAALVTLVGVVVGVPVLLATLAGNPLPHTLPSLADVGHALTARDNGELFLHALTVVAWLAWAAFTLAVLVEIRATILRRPARRLPGLALPQRAAASLVAAVTLIANSPAMASAASASPFTTPDRPAVVTTTTEYASGSTGTPVSLIHGARVDPSTGVVTSRAAPGPVYQVRRGDWLGHIAERYLGDFNRYPEIAALNPAVEARDHRFPDHIEEPWRIVLPADARDRGTRPHATGHLLAPAVDGNPTPPSPGPQGPAGTGGDGSAVPAPPAAPGSAAPTTSPAPGPSTPPSASATAPAAPSPAADAASSTTSPRPSSAAAPPVNGHRPAEDDSILDHALVVGVPLRGAGLLAALTLTTLRRRRRRQEQHRPVGRRLPDPVEPKVETDLRVVAQPASVDRLDHALRALGAALVDRPAEQMPDIVGAWLDGDTVNLLLTGECPDPPVPWIGDHLNWTLPATAELPEHDGQLAPLPTLVAVGSQPGMHLLLDLERLGLLTITGDPVRCGDLLRYLAAELACNAWSDHVEITVAGFDAAETSELLALGGDRITAATSVTAAIERVRRRASQVVASLDHLGASDPVTGRIADIAADAWMPHVLLARNPRPAELAALDALDADLAAAGRCAVAVAATTTQETGRWPLSIDASGRLTIAFLGMTGDEARLTAAGLPRTELTSLAGLLDTARRGTAEDRRSGQPDLEPEDWPRVPPAPEPEPWAHGTDAAGGLLDELPDAVLDEEPDVERDPTDDEAPPPDARPAGPMAGDEQPAVAAPSSAASDQATADRPYVDAAAQIPAVVALAGRHSPPRRRVTEPVRARRHSDPTLDTDVRAWLDRDPSRPRIAILGPVIVEASGQEPKERPRFYAEIIVYLAVRGARGATIDQFDEALWPAQPVKAASRRVSVARARRWLGETPDGEPWLADATADRRYRLRDGYLLDWHLFRRLRTRGESRGPAGVSDLHQALALVRGVPLAGADIAYSSAARNPYVWLPTSEIQPHHLASAVVDTAHRLVELCLEGGDLAGARWAVDQAWLADPDRASDIAWRDLLRVAAAEGNTAELDQLLGELMQAREAEVPEDLDRETYRLLCDLMPERMRAGVR